MDPGEPKCCPKKKEKNEGLDAISVIDLGFPRRPENKHDFCFTKISPLKNFESWKGIDRFAAAEV
jgi:hypothetical protein